MKAKEKINNDEINLQADALTDLPVAEELAEETKAGVLQGGAGRDVLLGGAGDDILIAGDTVHR